MEKERIHKLRIESLKNKYATDVQRSDHNERTSNPTKSDTKDGVMSDTLKNYIESQNGEGKNSTLYDALSTGKESMCQHPKGDVTFMRTSV